MPKQEILPPISSTQVQVVRPKPAAVTARVPGIPQSGAVDAYFQARRYGYTTKVANALTALNDAEASLYNAQTRVVVAKIRRDDALFALQEAPERRGHELQVRRIERANELREAVHHYEVNEYRRLKEVKHGQAEYVHAKAMYTRAEVDLTDAHQQLEAQRKHGGLNYELAHAEQNLKRLDIQLSERERRALMRKQLRDIEGPDDARQRDADRLDEEIAEDLDEISGRSK